MPYNLSIDHVDSNYRDVDESYPTMNMEYVDLDTVIGTFERLMHMPVSIDASVDPQVTVSGPFGLLVFNVRPEVLTYSNPANINQQNISISIDELPSVISASHAPTHGTDVVEPESSTIQVHGGLELLKLASLLVVLVLTAAAVYLLVDQVSARSYEGPVYEEIIAEQTFDKLADVYCADYAHVRELGEIFIRIHRDGLIHVYLQTHSSNLPDEPEEVLEYEFVISGGEYAILLVDELALIKLGDDSIVFFGDEVPKLPGSEEA